MTNDYYETPEGVRINWIRPAALSRGATIVAGQVRQPGVSYIDQWVQPESYGEAA